MQVIEGESTKEQDRDFIASLVQGRNLGHMKVPEDEEHDAS